MKTTLTTLGIFLLVLAGCAGQKKTANDFIQENIDNAVAQETLQTDIIEKIWQKFLIRVPLIRMVAFTTFLSTTGALVSFPVIFGIRTN